MVKQRNELSKSPGQCYRAEFLLFLILLLLLSLFYLIIYIIFIYHVYLCPLHQWQMAVLTRLSHPIWGSTAIRTRQSVRRCISRERPLYLQHSVFFGWWRWTARWPFSIRGVRIQYCSRGNFLKDCFPYTLLLLLLLFLLLSRYPSSATVTVCALAPVWQSYYLINSTKERLLLHRDCIHRVNGLTWRYQITCIIRHPYIHHLFLKAFIEVCFYL